MFPEPSPYELVIDMENWCVSWDSHHGVYRVYEDNCWSDVADHWWEDDDPEIKPTEVLWPSQFTSKFPFYDGREQPYLLYEPDSTYEEPFASSKRYRNHFVQDGETVCHVNKYVPKPYSEKYTPMCEISEDDWEELGWGSFQSNICTHCCDVAQREGIGPYSEVE